MIKNERNEILEEEISNFISHLMIVYIVNLKILNFTSEFLLQNCLFVSYSSGFCIFSEKSCIKLLFIDVTCVFLSKKKLIFKNKKNTFYGHKSISCRTFPH